MNIDHFIQSELKVTASENLDINSDLSAVQTKNISELLYNEEEENTEDQIKNQKEEENK